MSENLKTGNNSAEQLLSIIQRVERLTEEKAVIANDIKEVFAEAKMNGFDTKAIRILIKERAQDKVDLAELDAILDTYRHALGMSSDTPLGESAMDRLDLDRLGA